MNSTLNIHQRKELYQRCIVYIENNGMRAGLCHALLCTLHAEYSQWSYCDPYHMYKGELPELWEQRPEDVSTCRWWFPLGQIKPRIDCLLAAIELCDIKIDQFKSHV